MWYNISCKHIYYRGDMVSWEVEFYETETGVKCVQDYLDAIDNVKLKAKVLNDIALLKQFGTELQMPHARRLEDGIWELRTKQSSNIARTLYFTVSNKKIILLHGFIKKTQKTPPAELERAKTNKKDYIRRHS